MTIKILVLAAVVMMGCSGGVVESGDEPAPLPAFAWCTDVESECDLKLCGYEPGGCAMAYVLDGVALDCDACSYECAAVGPAAQSGCR